MLELTGVDAFYDKAQALFRVSLSVEPGSLHVVLGRNGAGKTSLFRAVTNTGVRKTGRVVFNGADITKERCFRIARRGLQLVPEARALIRDLTVSQNLGLARHAVTGSRQAVPLPEIVERFPTLRPLLQRNGGHLSGGQTKLVTLAKAFIANPDCILIDEPFEGISHLIAESLAEVILIMAREEHKTVVVAGQKLSALVEVADRVTVLADGTVVHDSDGASYREGRDALEKQYLAV